jgi:hypothetical protein
MTRKLTLMLLILLGNWFAAAHLDAAGNTSCSISMKTEIKERLVLRVSSGAGTSSASGQNQAEAKHIFRMEDNPVQIQAFLRIGRNETVALYVRKEIIDEQGDPIAAPDIGWQASGPGFQNGILSKGSTQVMARWTGPDHYEGTANYYYVGPKITNTSPTYVIYYSLVVL